MRLLPMAWVVFCLVDVWGTRAEGPSFYSFMTVTRNTLFLPALDSPFRPVGAEKATSPWPDLGVDAYQQVHDTDACLFPSRDRAAATSLQSARQ
ncbi:hypothetical protein BDP81DRAFT_431588 [Colletotrichum phormii]|uniref:Uncharacterized protein n=1 Tax=Colletotrichum phormii TaxID=359342 RepID=A0AAI9ZMW0_9PEZI|nr:uncharacterized protein BDP81DRAFT_431588 [Colletotrichum phormii]KAK1634590.1 hypothetical protein BDP81DRAFT_431588 [Colletotrichum phormii]